MMLRTLLPPRMESSDLYFMSGRNEFFRLPSDSFLPFCVCCFSISLTDLFSSSSMSVSPIYKYIEINSKTAHYQAKLFSRNHSYFGSWKNFPPKTFIWTCHCYASLNSFFYYLIFLFSMHILPLPYLPLTHPFSPNLRMSQHIEVSVCMFFICTYRYTHWGNPDCCNHMLFSP